MRKFIIKSLVHITLTILKIIYKSLILTKLEYSVFLYIDAKNSALKMIETIHNKGLRLTTGKFRLSPISQVFSILRTPLHLTLRERKTPYSKKLNSTKQHYLEPAKHNITDNSTTLSSIVQEYSNTSILSLLRE